MSDLGATYVEAVKAWRDQKAAGASHAELVANLEKTLRAAWPQAREEPWHYLCDACWDTGLKHQECPGDATCSRPKLHQPHSFGTPCWCPQGAKWRPRTKDATADLAQVGKVTTKQFSRVGRWP